MHADGWIPQLCFLEINQIIIFINKLNLKYLEYIKQNKFLLKLKMETPIWLVEHVSRLPEIAVFCSAKSTTSSATSKQHVVPTAVFYTEEMSLHRPLTENSIWNGERPERVIDTFKELRESGLLEHCITSIPCRRATKDELLLVHTPEHVELMLSLQYCVDAETLMKVSSSYNTLFMNEKSIDAALFACGSVIQAVDAVIKSKECRHAACLVRPPGHHAEDGRCMGFSIFNNVAVAAKYAQVNLGVDRILIVDWDVHHGNGIQDIFENDPNVCFFSVHRWDHGAFYPGFVVEGVGSEVGGPSFVGGDKVETAKGKNINLGWFGSGMYGAPSMGNGDYKAAFDRLLMPIAKSFNPSLIIVAAGFDAARGDHLGEMDLTPQGYSFMTNQLTSLGCPVIVSLEGGYNIPSVKYSFGACVASLLGIVEENGESFNPPKTEANACIDATIDNQKSFWPGLL
jgi:acetoin utilization deacetylase AcuC-like enzyme